MMKAYAVFDGGGVKGAALAGCLQAAESRGIKFQGFGGTSAGSIVALLAAVGYSGDEMRSIMVDEISFTDLLDDSGALLQELKALSHKFTSKTSAICAAWTHRKLLSKVCNNLGIYTASKVKDFLAEKIKRKLPNLASKDEITFDDLAVLGLPPLKVMVSDVVMRKPRVYAASAWAGQSGVVIEAVRASMSYPFVFQPVRVHDRLLVDGGLSSNLPFFMFEEERRKDSLPVIAFDLTSSRRRENNDYGVRHFCGDMLATALESGDLLLEKVISGVYHVRVPIPDSIDSLDFSISKEQRRQLFDAGRAATYEFFDKTVPQWQQAQNSVESIQALFVQPRLVEPLLKSFAREVEEVTPARNTRAQVMLPTPRKTRIVAYHYNMDNDPDSDLELAIEGGGYRARLETSQADLC